MLVAAPIAALIALLISSNTIMTGNQVMNHQQVAFAQGNTSQPTPPLNQNVV